MTTRFRSRWRRELQAFIDFRHTYFTSAWPAQTLLKFDAYVAAQPRASLADAIDRWLNREPSGHASTRANDRRAVRQFCLYRRRFDPHGFVPAPIEPAVAGRSSFKAVILSATQVRMLLHAIPELRGPPLRHARLRALFLALYCTGLRLGEALRLRLADVDLRRCVFTIGPSKGRRRLVPFGHDLARELRRWLTQRRQAGFVLTPATPLFEREDGRPDTLWNAGMRFNTLFRHCGLKPKRGSGRVGLRVHDLRHTFAVHRLERWYRTNRNPGPLLPWLSAYLGHGHLLGTQHYLRATPHTLATASHRFRRSLSFDPAAP